MGRRFLPSSRLVWAVLVGVPLGGVVAFTLAVLMKIALRWLFSGDAHPPADLLWLAPTSGAMIGLVAGVPATLVLGLPAHMVLHKAHQTAAIAYAAAGVLVGAMLPFALAPFNFFDSLLGWPPDNLPLATIFGACCAIGFWLIRRPDRGANSSVIPDTPQA